MWGSLHHNCTFRGRHGHSSLSRVNCGVVGCEVVHAEDYIHTVKVGQYEGLLF